MNAEKLRIKAQEMCHKAEGAALRTEADCLSDSIADRICEEADVLRALYERTFPDFGGPPTLEEFDRGLKLWLVIHPDGGLYLVNPHLCFHLDGSRGLSIRCDGRGELDDRSQRTRGGSPAWTDLRCRPVDKHGNAIPRTP